MSDIIYPTITIDINDHIKEQFDIANNSTFINTSLTPAINTDNLLDTLVEGIITQEEEE